MLPNTMPPVWMLDACCALNLVASGHFEAVLRTPLNSQTVIYTIAAIAVREAASLRHGGSGEDANEREPIDWNPYLASGAIQLEAPAVNTELALFVSLATQIDDGEAMTLALASSRGYGIITDDRKAHRFLGSVPYLGTPDLLHNWSVVADVDAPILGAALRAIDERANFAAPRWHPLRDWWNTALSIR